MKLVQIIRPLFLMAVGLHALALFLPIGESEPEVVEDVDISELSEEAPKSRLPASLPVPDPNVTAQAKPGAQAKLGTGIAKPAIAGSPTAVASRSGASTAATAARPAAAPSITATSPATQRRPVARPSAAPTIQPTPSAANPPPPSSSLPVLNQSDNDSDSGSTSTSGNSSSGSQANSAGSGSSSSSGGGRSSVSIAALLEKVTQQVPNSLRALATDMEKSLTYNPENTDDNSAEQAREEWKSNIQKQANVGTIERIEPTELDGLAEVTYPIEISAQSVGQPLSLCLEKEPHNAEIGVLFDTEGNIVDPPTIIRSTGYSALNEEIQAMVAAYEEFPSDRNSKAYSFEIKVEYDDEACVSLEELKE